VQFGFDRLPIKEVDSTPADERKTRQLCVCSPVLCRQVVGGYAECAGRAHVAGKRRTPETLLSALRPPVRCALPLFIDTAPLAPRHRRRRRITAKHPPNGGLASSCAMQFLLYVHRSTAIRQTEKESRALDIGPPFGVGTSPATSHSVGRTRRIRRETADSLVLLLLLLLRTVVDGSSDTWVIMRLFMCALVMTFSCYGALEIVCAITIIIIIQRIRCFLET